MTQALNAGIKERNLDTSLPVIESLMFTNSPSQEKHQRNAFGAHLRVCGDYSATVSFQHESHCHPLPRPKELMQRRGSEFGFTKIYLADAYNQIRLAPELRKRLALSTHRGILLQNFLSFGIFSAPGYFQKS